MGRAPFMSSTLTQLMQDILNKDPPPMPGKEGRGMGMYVFVNKVICAVFAGASPEFTDLISRLVDKNPATRIKWPVRGGDRG